jgi:hypothetical protein
LQHGIPALRERDFIGRTAQRRQLAGSALSVLLMICACIAPEYRFTAEPRQVTSKSEETMTAYGFSTFLNVEITGIDLSTLTEEQLFVLYQAAR